MRKHEHIKVRKLWYSFSYSEKDTDEYLLLSNVFSLKQNAMTWYKKSSRGEFFFLYQNQETNPHKNQYHLQYKLQEVHHDQMAK